MQEGICDAPALPIAQYRDSLVVQAGDLAAALSAISILEADDIAHRDFLSTEALCRPLSNVDVGTIEVDGGIVDEPALRRFRLQHHQLRATHLQDQAGAQSIFAGIEKLDALAALELPRDRRNPVRISQQAVDGRPQTVKLKRRGLIERVEDAGEIHGLAGFQVFGNRSPISRSSVVGRRVSTSVSQACGSMPLALAVAIRLMMAAARLPAVSDPANSQFLRPMAIGRIAFSIGLLSIG